MKKNNFFVQVVACILALAMIFPIILSLISSWK